MGVGKLTVYTAVAEAREGVEVPFTLRIDNTDWNPLNSELYRLTMHDDSPASPERCWWYDREGRLCSRAEDVERCWIWEGWVNALTDEQLTSSFLMPNFDVRLRFGLWRKAGPTWVKDDEGVLSVRLLRKVDWLRTALLIGGIAATAYLLGQVAKLVKR